MLASWSLGYIAGEDRQCLFFSSQPPLTLLCFKSLYIVFLFLSSFLFKIGSFTGIYSLLIKLVLQTTEPQIVPYLHLPSSWITSMCHFVWLSVCPRISTQVLTLVNRALHWVSHNPSPYKKTHKIKS